MTTCDTTDYSLADGVMIEGFSEWAVHQPFALGDWQLQMNRILSLEHRHKIVIAQSYLDSPSDMAVRRFYLGNYLLIKSDHTYVNYFASDEPEWYPEWRIPIGTPTAAVPGNVNALYVARSGVYRRTYTNGFTMVNPRTTARTVALGRIYYLAMPIGGGAIPGDADVSHWRVQYRPVTTITVAPNDAAILLTSPPPGYVGGH